MNPYAQILWSPWNQRRNQANMVGIAAVAALTALPLLLLLAKGGGRSRLILFAACLSIALLGIWVAQFANLLTQNQPTAARLVPGQLRYLRISAVGLWLLHTVIQVTLWGLIVNVSPILIWDAGLVLLLLASLARWPAAISPLFFITLFLKQVDIEVFQTLALAASPIPWPNPTKWAFIGSLLGLALGAGLLSRLLQSGSSQHMRSYSQRTWRRQAISIAFGGADAPARTNRWRSQLDQWGRWPYLAWQRHLIRTAAPTERSALARLELVLGPQAHWTQHVQQILLSTLFVAGATALAQWGSAGGILGLAHTYSNWAGYAVLFGAMAPLMAVPASMYRTRHEQALLILAPNVPTGTRLNMGLARRNLLRWFATWVIACGLVTLTLTLSHADSGTQLALGGMCAAYWPIGFLTWTDWARQTQPRGKANLLPLATFAAVAILTFGLVQMLHWSLLLAGAAWLLTCLFVGVWRWRQWAQYPQAMPAGRLAHHPVTA